MNLSLLFSAVLVVAAIGSHSARAESFSYSGSLQESGKQAEGSYDFRLVLYADAAGTKAISAPIVLSRVPIGNGSFSTLIDFGYSLETMRSAYLGEQTRRSGSKADFSAPSSDATIPLSAYTRSNLAFDGNSLLYDFDSVVDATITCTMWINGNCVKKTCKRDTVSDCGNFFTVCMDNHGTYEGNAGEASCEVSAGSI